jgi:hypothetical protein
MNGNVGDQKNGCLAEMLRIILGMIVGGAIGVGLGAGVPFGLAALSVWMTGDRTAGGAAMIMIGTAPLGLFFGAIIGAGYAARPAKRP